LGITYFYCKDTSYLVGSENIDKIEDVILTITSYTVYSSKLNGRGTIKILAQGPFFHLGLLKVISILIRHFH